MGAGNVQHQILTFRPMHGIGCLLGSNFVENGYGCCSTAPFPVFEINLDFAARFISSHVISTPCHIRRHARPSPSAQFICVEIFFLASSRNNFSYCRLYPVSLLGSPHQIIYNLTHGAGVA
jgi:hypothetical protein